MLEPKSITNKESDRLYGLANLRILDTEPEPLFDLLALQAARACVLPYARISLVDDKRVWFKANQGLTGFSQTHREHSFCAHVIETGAFLEVVDTRLDPRSQAANWWLARHASAFMPVCL